MTHSLIEPRTLKGFRDFLPTAMISRERLINTAQRVYRSYGYRPIDTPALEYLDILAGKGGEETDKQMYRFQDHGGRWVGLRFDLTVPLARFAAQHLHQLGTYFKRYHIGTVWRGENTQRGRYREFMQCDFDIIGTLAPAADVETILVIHDLMTAIGFSRFTIRINNRLVLSGMLQELHLPDRAATILRSLDKLSKIGTQAVAAELTEHAGLTQPQADQLLALASIKGPNDAVLRELQALAEKNNVARDGVDRLREVADAVLAAGVPGDRLQVDPSIARGLDYYTGIVFETFLDELPSIGSVCSGGRYDNLAKTYTNQQLPGIGGSLGLDRLLAAMEELKMIEPTGTPADVFIPYFDRDRLHDYLRLAAALRRAGLGVEFFPEPKKLGAQLQYADKLGFRAALILGSNEWASGLCQVKNLAAGESQVVPLEPDARSIVDAVRQALRR